MAKLLALSGAMSLPFQDLSTLGVPLPLDQSRFEEAVLTESLVMSVSNCRLGMARITVEYNRKHPNKLIRVGDLHFTQDSALDRFSGYECFWKTLEEVVSGRKTIYRPFGSLANSASWLPTLRVAKVSGVWYSEATRRVLLYKIVFSADQLIPVLDLGPTLN